MDGTGTATQPTSDQLTSSFGAVAVGSKVQQAPECFNRDRITGYIYQANLDIQYQITPTLLLDIGYLGTLGHHLSATTDMPWYRDGSGIGRCPISCPGGWWIAFWGTSLAW